MKNISEVVAGLQELFNQVKYFHWQTKSFAQHEALGKVFDGLEDLIDDFVEVAMGKYGRPSTKKQTLQMFDLEDVDIMEWATGVVDYLLSFDDVLDETVDTDLLNIRDEMMALVNKLKYLLTLKESKKKKRVIKLTEGDLQRIVERVISEGDSGKFRPLATNNSEFMYEGVIGKDGYLYPYTESLETYKIGPIAKVPYQGGVRVYINTKGDKPRVYVGRTNVEKNLLELVPNYTVTKVDYYSIPRKPRG